MLQEKIERLPDQALRVVRPQPASQPPADDPRVDLKELIRVMQRRRKIILWTAAVPVLLALLYGLLATPLYTSSTQILIDPRDRRIISNEVTPENARRGRRRCGGREPASGHHLRHGAAPRDRARASRHRSGIRRRAGPASARPIAARRARASASAAEGGDRRTEGAAPAQEAHRREALRQGLRRRSLSSPREGREKSVRIADAIAQAYLDDQTEARAAALPAAPRRRSADGSTRCARACRKPKTASSSIKRAAQAPRRRRRAGQRPAAQRDERCSSTPRAARPPRRAPATTRSSARASPASRAAPSRRRCCRRPSGSCARNMPKSRASAPSWARSSARAIPRSSISMRRSRACRS